MHSFKVFSSLLIAMAVSATNAADVDIPPSAFSQMSFASASLTSESSHESKLVSSSRHLAYVQENTFSTITGTAVSNENSYFSVKQRQVNSPFLYNERDEDARFESTRLSFSKTTDWGQWQFANTTGNSETQHELGLSLGRFSLSAATGHGDVFVTSENQFQSIDPFLVHGGNYLKYSHSTGSLGYEFGGNLKSQFAASKVTSPGVDDRHAYALSFSGKRFEATLLNAQRDNKNAARGLDLSLSLFGVNSNYTQLSAANGAAHKMLSFAWGGKTKKQYTLSFESKRNPLYRQAEDSRVMLSVSGLFKKPGAFFADENEQTEGDGGEKKKGGAGIGIGVGLAAVALAASSGSSSKDDSSRVADQHAAARRVLNRINPVSVRENREHGGVVFRNPDGSFAATPPIAGDVASVNIGPAFRQVPAGSRATASYHTHGGPDPRFINEQFSPQDLLGDRLAGIDGYLGTPAGAFKYHNHKTGEITTLGRIAN